MRLHERLLRLSLGRYETAALIGDLEEEAARLGASSGWIRKQALLYAMSSAWLAVRRQRTRLLTSARLAFRDARRSILRFRATSLAAVLILALSMAAGTVTFAVVDTIVLRPLPYPDADALVTIYGTTPKEPQSLLQSPADFYAWRDGTTSFEGLAAWNSSTYELKSASGAHQIGAVETTSELFGVLRARPLLGSVFGREHESPGRDGVAVISYELWQRHFGGASDVVGRTIRSSRGLDVAVLGVMPRGFMFPASRDVPAAMWRPLVIRPEQRTITAERGRARYVQVVGRLRDGVSLDQARADVERVAASMATVHPSLYADWKVRLDSMLSVLTEGVRGWMLIALCAAGLVLAVACANVGNLLLAQASARQREIAIRASLGATRAQIVSSLLVESLLLGIIAASAGVLLAYWGLEAVKSVLPAGTPRAAFIRLDMRILAGAVGASLITTMICGAVPAWQGSKGLLTRLKEGGFSTPGPVRMRWRGGFLVAQVALVSVLLVATTLLVSSFVRLLSIDLGFSKENLIGARLMPAISGPKESTDRRMGDFFAQAVHEAGTIPGVVSVATLAGAHLPLYQGSSTTRLTVPGGSAAAVLADMRRVSPEYFETTGIRILRGRGLGEQEQSVVMLDQLAAMRLFGSEDPLGRRVVIYGLGELTVVGITASVRLLGPEGIVQPQVHLPITGSPYTRVLLVRTSIPPAQIAPELRARIAGLMPRGSAPFTVDIVDDRFQQLTADRRFSATLMTAFGCLALVIGLAGIYSVTASIVAQQTHEIGVRIALGATSRRVVGSIALATGRLIFAGTALGFLAAWAASSVLKGLVFGIEPTDLSAFALPFCVLSIVGLAGAMLPAVRAARIDPLIVLRNQ